MFISYIAQWYLLLEFSTTDERRQHLLRDLSFRIFQNFVVFDVEILTSGKGRVTKDFFLTKGLGFFFR